MNDPLYKDAFKYSQSKEKQGVPNDQKGETQTEGHLEVQGNTTLDVETGDNPPMTYKSVAPKIQKDYTSPSGNTDAKDKRDEIEKKDVGSAEDKVAEVDKGKGVID